MDQQLELIDHLRKKIKEVGKKSAARKTALKQLEKAYKLSEQTLHLAVSQNIIRSQQREKEMLEIKEQNELLRNRTIWHYLYEIF